MGSLSRFINRNGLVIAAHLLMVILIVVVSGYQRVIILFSVLSVAPIYLNHFLLIPRLLNDRKLWHYVGSIMLMLILYSLMIYAIMWISFYLNVDLGVTISKSEKNWGRMLIGMTVFLAAIMVIMGLVTSIIRLINDSMEVAEMRERLMATQSEKVAAELAGLKSQVNPHFFFNSINNIYALSLDASPETPTYILKLSGLMRYVLYECNQPFVSLCKELEFLRSYIDLQSIRLSKLYSVEFIEDVENCEQPIAPLLFLPLVENCFKHGLGSAAPSVIRIQLKAGPGRILLKTENPFTPTMFSQAGSKVGHIGIINVEQRLALIYPGRHSFSYGGEGGVYRTEISIAT